MTEQELIATFVYPTVGGRFGVLDPTEHDQTIGYFDTEVEAGKALMDFIEKEGITFE